MKSSDARFRARGSNGYDVRSAYYTDGRERPVGTLFKDLMSDVQSVVRDEVRLARIEASRNASKAGKHAGTAAVGGLIAYLGAFALMLSLGFLLASFMPDWLGFLITAALFLIVGGSMASSGIRRLKNEDYSFELTSRTLQEDKRWMQEEVQEVKDDPKRLGARQ